MSICSRSSMLTTTTSNEAIKGNKGRVVGRTWLASSSYSVILTIPKHLAEKHGITEPCHIVFEDLPEGILIRKLKFT
jgi:hypothetical protein